MKKYVFKNIDNSDIKDLWDLREQVTKEIRQLRRMLMEKYKYLEKITNTLDKKTEGLKHV